MIYKIVDIEGIGPVYAEKLIAAGINTDKEMLEKCCKPAGRKALAEETGISPKLILTWANHCDLMRINGVGPQFSELLEAAGVDTVKEFRNRKPENLQPKRGSECREEPLQACSQPEGSGEDDCPGQGT